MSRSRRDRSNAPAPPARSSASTSAIPTGTSSRSARTSRPGRASVAPVLDLAPEEHPDEYRVDRDAEQATAGERGREHDQRAGRDVEPQDAEGEHPWPFLAQQEEQAEHDLSRADGQL